MNRHMRRHPDLYGLDEFGLRGRGLLPTRDNGGGVLGGGGGQGGAGTGAGGKTPEQIAAEAAEAERLRNAGGAGQGQGQPLMIGGQPATQADLDRLLAREKDQGRNAGRSEAEQALLTRLGVTNVDEAEAILKAHRERQQENETEAERKAREADERTAAAEARAGEADKLIRLGVMREALRDEGAPKDALGDLVVLLGAQPDVDIAKPESVEAAAKALKAKYPGMFGTTGGAPSGDPGSSGGGGGQGGGGTGLDAGRDQFEKDKAAGKVNTGIPADPFAGFRTVGAP